SIKESERKVVEDTSLTTIEKIRRILGVLPDSYKNVDLGQLYILREKYPDIYVKVEERLETGWDQTIALIEQGIQEGVVRPVNIKLVKMMFEASIEQFFSRDILVKNGINYLEALDEVVNIIVEGIAAR
ncbi:MAG: TetR/AcrR family transcriptional regulator, partial [Lachnospiraceae bacterium]|nr:TetR/AcrR family transcriptional regulator [Lachnospiraceae bacterium]